MDLPQLLLVATAASTILAAVLTLGAMLLDVDTLGRTARQIAIGLSILCGAILTALLLNEPDSAIPVSSSVVEWLAFPDARSFSITFGFVTTWIQSLAVTVCGLAAWIAMAVIESRTKSKQQLSSTILLVSSLYAAGTVYLFAPNVSQALFGWLGVSYFAYLLFRHSSDARRASQTSSNGQLRHSSIESNSAPQWDGLIANTEHIAAYWLDRVWVPITRDLPDSIGQQWEQFESEPPSLHLIAASLAASIVLLTWLMAP